MGFARLISLQDGGCFHTKECLMSSSGFVAICFLAGIFGYANPDLEALKTYQNQPLIVKLSTPVNTFNTLCFAADAYFEIPSLMAEAFNCLEIEPGSVSPDVLNRMILDLEEILDELSVPLNDLNPLPGQDHVVVFKDESLNIVLKKCQDGLWRFDKETVSRIKAMRAVSASRTRARKLIASQLKSGLHDPNNTMSEFMEHAYNNDFITATHHLDLSEFPPDKIKTEGALICWKLAAIIQRKGYLFTQEIPEDPEGPKYIWNANSKGMIAVQRVYRPGGKDAWLFTKDTIRAVDSMYEDLKNQPIDIRYKIMGRIIPPVPANFDPLLFQLKSGKPDSVPDELSTPRKLLRNFYLAIMMAEFDIKQKKNLNNFLDLSMLPIEDLENLGPKRAVMLDAILRKISPDSNNVVDSWSSSAQVIEGPPGFNIGILRQHDGCWRFSPETVANIPTMFAKLSSEEQAKYNYTHDLANPRNAIFFFLASVNLFNDREAMRALDLSELPVPARHELGPVLAFKLKYIIDRVSQIYLQEIPTDPKLIIYELYRGPLGKIFISPHDDGKGKMEWKFDASSVRLIEKMFNSVIEMPVRADLQKLNLVRLKADFWSEPGIWLRLNVPMKYHHIFFGLCIYQWVIGLILACLSVVVAICATFLVKFSIHYFVPKSTNVVFKTRIRRNLRALRLLIFFMLIYSCIPWLDLPNNVAIFIYTAEQILVTLIVSWFCLQLVDTIALIYEISESMVKYKGVADMLVPFLSRGVKLVIILTAISLLIKNFGETESLGRFLAGLGILGIGISLAAQDSLKNLFGTLLLISEKSFRVGDKIILGDKEGIVEQLGFRATKLRTAEDSLLLIPNGNLATAIIDNYGFRKQRRLRLVFGIDLHTEVEKIGLLHVKLLEKLVATPRVIANKTKISFLKIGENGLEFEVSAFADIQNDDQERSLKEAILEIVLQLALEMEIKTTNLKK
ncbi:MAG: mechanosensitive ion channel family protein [Planctomycetes bacterium]|nr:mechanosensitive ion channel family protein [Planctomycetota bacterium]